MWWVNDWLQYEKNWQNYACHDSNFQNLDRANNHPANINDRSQAKPAYSYPLIIFQPNGIARISFSYLEIYSNGQHTLKGVWGCVLTKQEGGVGQKLRTCSTLCMQEGGGVGQKGQNLAYLLCIRPGLIPSKFSTTQFLTLISSLINMLEGFCSGVPT